MADKDSSSARRVTLPGSELFLLDFIPDSVIVVDASQTVLFANQSAGILLGRPTGEITGLPLHQALADWSDLIPPFFPLQQEVRFEAVIRQTGCPQRHIQVSVKLIEGSESWPPGYLLLFRNIPSQKQLELSPQENYHFLDQAVRDSPNPIFSVNRSGQVISWNLACESVFGYGQEMVGEKLGRLLSNPLQQEELKVQIDAIFDQRLSFNKIEITYRSSDDQEKFMISCLYPMLDANGHVTACIIANTDLTERKKSEQSLRRQLNELTILNAIATACVEAVEEDELIARITQYIGQILQADNYGILLVDEKGNHLTMHSSFTGLSDQEKNTIIHLGQGVTGHTAISGSSRVVPDVNRAPEYLKLSDPTRSEISVPIKVGERVIGVIDAESSSPNAFDQSHERLLAITANQLATAIERLRAEKTVRQRVQELLAITRVGQEITALLDRQQVLESIVRLAAEISGSGASGLYSYRPDERFYLVAAFGVSDHFIQVLNSQGVPFHGSAVGKAVETRRPYQIADIYQEPDYSPLALAEIEHFRSVLALPLLSGQEVLGGIVVWHRQPHYFTAEEETFLQALAQQSVTAIKNARLFEAEREGRQLAEVMREIGTTLSATLEFNQVLDRLLEQLSRLAPYEAANFMLISGDRCRVIRQRGYAKWGAKIDAFVSDLEFVIPETPNLQRMFESRQPLVIQDTTQQADWLSLREDLHVHSWAGAPVVIQDQVFAFFSLDHSQSGFFQPELTHLLSIFTSQAGLALQNSLLFEETRRRASQQEAINRIIAAAVAAPDLQSLLETTLDLIMAAVHVSVGGLWISGQHALRGIPEEIGQQSSQLSRSTTAPSQQTLVVEDWHTLRGDVHYGVWADFMEQYCIRATLAVPVLSSGKRVGALSLNSIQPRNWLLEEIALTQAVGQQLGSAAERLDLLARTREQARQVQQIIDTVPEGVLLLDSKCFIILANPTARLYLDRLGQPAEPGQPLMRLFDQPIEDLLSLPENMSWQEIRPQAFTGRIFEFAVRPVQVEPSQDHKGETRSSRQGWVIVLRDVTLDREKQARIEMQERLATVGQLAAGIAHDFNNIMAAVVVYTDLIAMDQNLSLVGRDQIRIIQQQIERASSLIRQILDFSRQSVIEQTVLDLLPFIKELDKLLERVLPENIHLTLSYQPGVYNVKADPARLQQALMNLAVNARDAMPEGGVLTFSLKRLMITEHSPERSHDLTPGEWIRLAISDTGPGIPPEIKPHIFDPFFTTKPVGQGTGLGLAQVYGIVKQHQGSIEVVSEPGKGATFAIYLPAHVVEVDGDLLFSDEMQPAGKGELVLIVEDDQAARQALQSLLEHHHYRVISAEDGEQALSIFDSLPVLPDLVISDLVMPQLGGLALYEALHKRQSDVKVLFITGHPIDSSSQALLEQDQIRWLQKPFSAREFTLALRKLLS